MISLIIESMIKNYFIMLLSIGCISLFIFLMGLYLILRKKPTRKQPSSLVQSLPVNIHVTEKNVTEKMVSTNDFVKDSSAIAGDNILATQLDLARAYIETGAWSFAKNILESVKQHGDGMQQKEAQALLHFLNERRC